MTVVADEAARGPAGPATDGQATDSRGAYREVRYEHSRNFPAVLAHLGASLLVSTYQAGKLFVVGARQGELTLSFHNFEQAMGIAVKHDRIAVGTRGQVWTLRSAPDIAPRLETAGRYDACYLGRTARVRRSPCERRPRMTTSSCLARVGPTRSCGMAPASRCLRGCLIW
jgi:hypothetical protein